MVEQLIMCSQSYRVKLFIIKKIIDLGLYRKTCMIIWIYGLIGCIECSDYKY